MSAPVGLPLERDKQRGGMDCLGLQQIMRALARMERDKQKGGMEEGAESDSDSGFDISESPAS